MRAFAFIAEPYYDGPDAPLFYGWLVSIYKVLADGWGFDALFCFDASGTDALEGDGPKVHEHYFSKAKFRRIKCWSELKRQYPDAKIVVLFPEGGTELGDFVEPDGDVIYVLGGDHTPRFNYDQRRDLTLTIPHSNKSMGVYSFCAMSVVASELYERYN